MFVDVYREPVYIGSSESSIFSFCLARKSLYVFCEGEMVELDFLPIIGMRTVR